jgi:hypothetical protein
MGDDVNMSFHRRCERSEAIQGPVHDFLGCFVASLLAMTEVVAT